MLVYVSHMRMRPLDHNSLGMLRTVGPDQPIKEVQTMTRVIRKAAHLPLIFLRTFCSTTLARLSSTSGFTTIGENEPDAYRKAMLAKAELLQKRVNDSRRFQLIGEREERSIIPAECTIAMVTAKYLSCYRGILMLKAPNDLSILYQMFWNVRPRTVIELGSFTGASALWMADALNGANIECSVFSVELDHSLLHPQIKSLQPPNLSFIQGDCNKIQEVFPSEFLSAQPHPFIVIDDAHTNFDNVMDHFHHHLTPGDYLVCEDTSPDVPADLLGITDKPNEWGYDKLHKWSRFLSKHGNMYAIDSFFSDLFGYNGSSNWNGYARRMK